MYIYITKWHTGRKETPILNCNTPLLFNVELFGSSKPCVTFIVGAHINKPVKKKKNSQKYNRYLGPNRTCSVGLFSGIPLL